MTPSRRPALRGWPDRVATAVRPQAVTLDQRIAMALQLRGRASWRDIARLLGTSESTVARRARALMEAGLIRITAVPDPLRCGFGYPVLVQLACSPDQVGIVAARLAERRDVRFLAAVTGPFVIVGELIVGSSRGLAGSCSTSSPRCRASSARPRRPCCARSRWPTTGAARS